MRKATKRERQIGQETWTHQEVLGVTKLLALKFVRGCEKNRDAKALEAFLTKYSRFVEPEEEIYSALIQAVSSSYTPPTRRPMENQEDRLSILQNESTEATDTKVEKFGDDSEWLYIHAWNIFHKMQSQGMNRSKEIYDSMIDLACKRASMKKAVSLLKDMKLDAELELLKVESVEV